MKKCHTYFYFLAWQFLKNTVSKQHKKQSKDADDDNAEEMQQQAEYGVMAKAEFGVELTTDLSGLPKLVRLPLRDQWTTAGTVGQIVKLGKDQSGKLLLVFPESGLSVLLQTWLAKVNRNQLSSQIEK